MIRRSPTVKPIREYLLNLDKKVMEGEYLNHAQITAFFDICKVMGYFSIRIILKMNTMRKYLEPLDLIGGKNEQFIWLYG
ncbi:hypothetical protein GCM10022392_13350 [Mucilaginibacter panaciglaebae]|uniref:Uncharacterized protein n=1 Tax=Mucilaginibacter panaciglaebae TaxID=502331 RepID=A0ABP7WNW9_9SPHI